MRPGSSTAEKFIDASTEGPGTFFLGMLADASSNTLWTCQLTPVPKSKPERHHTSLRSFVLATGAPKIRWNLPGDDSLCNDFTIGPDKALYITDTIPGRIFRLPAGASAAKLYLEQETLRGVDGITFLNGTLYVNNVIFNKLYRIPVDAEGKPGEPVDILDGPAGKRAGWHACGEREANPSGEWQRQNFCPHCERRPGKRDRDQRKTRHTHRSRTGR